MSYSYWNNFVNTWINTSPLLQQVQFQGWTNPTLIPLMNTPSANDNSIFYLPEPWWGNDGNHVLNSIVINYNPGSGGIVQHYNNAANLFGQANYSSFANSEAIGHTNYFGPTNKWHRSKRAKRVFNTLNRIGVALNGFENLHNHLSIELIPWHTQNTSTIQAYINQNFQVIFDNCIFFAANQSTRIANNKLKNKVILRLNGDYTIQLLNAFSANGICNFQVLRQPGYVPNGEGGYFKFSINIISNVEFISIWGMRNDLPSNADMDWIFKNVI